MEESMLGWDQYKNKLLTLRVKQEAAGAGPQHGPIIKRILGIGWNTWYDIRLVHKPCCARHCRYIGACESGVPYPSMHGAHAGRTPPRKPSS